MKTAGISQFNGKRCLPNIPKERNSIINEKKKPIEIKLGRLKDNKLYWYRTFLQFFYKRFIGWRKFKFLQLTQ